MSKIVRMIYPQWQGGFNPLYAEGAAIMAAIVPKSDTAETVEVSIDEDFRKKPIITNGIKEEEALIRQTNAAYRILEERDAEKVLTFGGDCSISQAPFDYLHGKYPTHTGMIWLDAHPDITCPDDRHSNNHAMVLANLLGDGAPTMAELVKHPFVPSQVLYAGLIDDRMWDNEKEQCQKFKIPVVRPEALADNSQPVLEWIKANDYRHILIHFDLDVLDAADFRSVFYNKPHSDPVSYATGKMTLAQAVRLITDVEQAAELVGLSIAEYAPWDAFNIREQFSKIKIFQ